MSLEDLYTSDGSSAEDNKKPLKLDLDNLDQYPDLDKTDLDLEADAFAQVAPPKPGKYQLALALGDGGIVLKTNINKQGQESKFYSTSVECTLISDDASANGAKCYVNLSTIIGRGKGISTMATLVQKGGGHISNKSSSHLDVVKDFAKFLRGDPKVWAEVDWELQYEDAPGHYTRVYSSYGQFPQLKSDPKVKQFSFEFKNKEGGLIKAFPRLYVKQWYGKDASSMAAKTTVAASSKTSILSGVSGGESLADLEAMMK